MRLHLPVQRGGEVGGRPREHLCGFRPPALVGGASRHRACAQRRRSTRAAATLENAERPTTANSLFSSPAGSKPADEKPGCEDVPLVSKVGRLQLPIVAPISFI